MPLFAIALGIVKNANVPVTIQALTQFPIRLKVEELLPDEPNSKRAIVWFSEGNRHVFADKFIWHKGPILYNAKENTRVLCLQ